MNDIQVIRLWLAEMRVEAEEDRDNAESRDDEGYYQYYDGQVSIIDAMEKFMNSLNKKEQTQ